MSKTTIACSYYIFLIQETISPGIKTNPSTPYKKLSLNIYIYIYISLFCTLPCKAFLITGNNLESQALFQLLYFYAYCTVKKKHIILTFSWLREFQCNVSFLNANLFFLLGNIYKYQIQFILIYIDQYIKHSNKNSNTMYIA